jgi:hypothetical protein
VIRTTTAAGDSWTYRSSDGTFKPWNGVISSLEPAYAPGTLQAADGFLIHSGSLVPATHRIFIGYSRNGTGILHYTGIAMLLQVTN